MASTSPEEVTQLLQAWNAGDEDAFERLVPLVYAELHRLARRYMRGERPGHTLQTTALLHEAYLRLRRTNHTEWHGRTHFLAVAAQLMRRVLVDFARSRSALKRGAGETPVRLDEARDGANERSRELLEIDEALRALAASDERKANVVEMRFFGGLTVDETSEALGISPETVMRDWKQAKRWLEAELSGASHET